MWGLKWGFWDWDFRGKTGKKRGKNGDKKEGKMGKMKEKKEGKNREK